MGSRRRKYIQGGTEFRGVITRNGEIVGYTGPYDTAGKAQASITRRKGVELFHRDVYDGYVQYCDPEWIDLDQ